MAVKIKIADEDTRWLVQVAAWGEGTESLERFDDECYVFQDEDRDVLKARQLRATELLSRMGDLSALCDRVGACALGDGIEVPSAVAVRVQRVRQYFDENLASVRGPNVDHDLDQKRTQRLRELYPAAERLAAELAGAVA